MHYEVKGSAATEPFSSVDIAGFALPQADTLA